MPKSNNSNLDILNNDANLSIYADHLGLTPQFVQDNKNRLERIERMVSKEWFTIKEIFQHKRTFI